LVLEARAMPAAGIGRLAFAARWLGSQVAMARKPGSPEAWKPGSPEARKPGSPEARWAVVGARWAGTRCQAAAIRRSVPGGSLVRWMAGGRWPVAGIWCLGSLVAGR
jgi:hypothetical protein